MALDTGTVAAVPGIDEAYEFCAPRFFDFITEETEEAVRAAESWFEAARSHAPSRTYPRAAEAFFLVDRPPSLPVPLRLRFNPDFPRRFFPDFFSYSRFQRSTTGSRNRGRRPRSRSSAISRKPRSWLQR